jgi:hypothetical protein
MDGDREERIRRRAHVIWEREGQPHGSDQQHWDQATSEIDAEDAKSANPAQHGEEAPRGDGASQASRFGYRRNDRLWARCALPTDRLGRERTGTFEPGESEADLDAPASIDKNGSIPKFRGIQIERRFAANNVIQAQRVTLSRGSRGYSLLPGNRGCLVGMVKLNVVRPTSDVTERVPPCACAIWDAI